jgi:hypothetical protein
MLGHISVADFVNFTVYTSKECFTLRDCDLEFTEPRVENLVLMSVSETQRESIGARSRVMTAMKRDGFAKISELCPC